MNIRNAKLPLVLAALVLLIDVAFVGVLGVRFPSTVLVNNAIDIWFDQTDPTIAVFEREKATFADESWVLANVWAANDQPETLAGLSSDLTRAFERIDGVGNVLSPQSLDVLQADEEGLYYDRLPAELGWTERAARLQQHPVARNLLVYEDEPTLLSFVIRESIATDEQAASRQRLVDDLRAALHEEPRIQRAALVGTPVMNSELNRLSWRDFLLLIPASSIAIVLVVLMLVRTSWRLCAAVVTSASMATVSMCAAMLVAGTPFNMLTIGLPGVVFTLGVASCLHVLHHYLVAESGAAPAARAWRTTRHLLRPIVVSHVTTALGFGLLISVPVLPVDMMALYGAAGVLWAGVHSALVAPQLFALFAPGIETPRKPVFRGTAPVVERVLKVATRLPALSERRSTVTAVLLGAAGLMALAISLLNVDSTYLTMIDADERVRHDYASLDAADLPSAQLSILIDKPAPDALVDAELNAAIAEASRRITELAPVRKVIGPGAIYDEVAAQLADDRPLAEYSSDPLAVTDAYIFALTGGNQEVPNYIGDSLENFRLVVLFEYLDNSALRALVQDDLQNILERTLTPVGARAEVSGVSVLWSNMDDAILRGQLVSVLTIAAICFAVFFASTRQLRIAVIATLVNFLPMAGIAAVMGLTGMKLDLAAIFVLGLSLGIAIDDTSFFVHRYTQVRDDNSEAAALNDTLRVTAPPMLATSLVIVIGFSVLFLSSFIPMRVFGGFTAMGVLFAALFDCFILPLMLAVYGSPRREEAVVCPLTTQS